MWQRILSLVLSFGLVAFGQPALCPGCGLVAAVGGYALLWIAISTVKHPFWVATLWYTAVQLVQLVWFVSHPYLYIWGVYLSLSLALGLQFGLMSWLVRREALGCLWKVAALAGFWTLLEGARLFFLSGFSWNPVGLALTGNTYPLQMASIAGIYGLSFWVMLTNGLVYRAYFLKKGWVLVALAALFPYVFGWAHLTYHEREIEKHPPKEVSALLVQTAFPIEECLDCPPEDLVAYVEGEWREILQLLKGHEGEKLDLIALPEYVVPFGTWADVWKKERVEALFEELFGARGLAALAATEMRQTLVSNAYILQGIATLFDVDVISGLEDAEQKGDRVEHYNAALHFKPGGEGENPNYDKRYAKRVLVPMGEYIPFEWCRDLAARYGIAGSFTPGEGATVFQGKKGAYGLSICYEETYAHLMRENKLKGADVLLNLTSDVWYPNSRLPQQHLDHARLRALEGGLPLLRACNTGVTCGIDSLGRTVKSLGNDEWRKEALFVKLPLYGYSTLYTKTGDTFVMGFSGILVLLMFLPRLCAFFELIFGEKLPPAK